MKKISIGTQQSGKQLFLDVDVLLKTRLLIQANSGGGKSWLIRRLAEQLFGIIPVIIIDPEGEFATLREKFGFVLVGKGGETPADHRSAKMVAHTLLELRASAVIDLYEMNPQERHAYVKAFSQAMIDAPKHLWRPTVIIFDEAHTFCPEKGAGESVASDAVTAFPTRGRKRRFCAVFATQRLGKLRKDASAELLNRLVGPTFEDIDLKRAAELLSVTGEQRREFDQQMRIAESGQFYAFGRALCKERTLLKIGPVQTSHEIEDAQYGSEPPPAPETVRAMLPKLADLPKQAETKAQTEAELKRENAGLRRELAQKTLEADKQKPETITIPAVTDADWQKVKQAAELFESLKLSIDSLEARARDTFKALGTFGGQIATLLHRTPVHGRPGDQFKANAPVQFRTTKEHRQTFPRIGKIIEKVEPPRAGKTPLDPFAPNGELRGGQLQVMKAVAQYYPDGIASETIAVLTGYRSTSRYEFLRQLKSSGYVEESGDQFKATASGIDALGSNFEPLPTGRDLLEYWRNKLTGGEKLVFEVVVQSYPDPIWKDRIMDATGFKSTSVYEFTRQLKARRIVVAAVAGSVSAAPELFE